MKINIVIVIMGIVLSELVFVPEAKAQFGFGIVHDPTAYALQVQKRIEETSRWLETIRHYTEIYENAVNQLTTLRGVLRNAEQLLAFDRKIMSTISSIGRSIRTSFRIKNQIESLIVGRARALREIDQRLRNGLFDPDADRRDLEGYLRASIGRTSQDALANMERLERMDNSIARAHYDMRRLQANKAEAEEHLKAMQERVQALRDCEDCTEKDREIQALGLQIFQAEQQLEQTNMETARLRQEITDRTEAIAEREEARLRFGTQVNTLKDGWKKLVEAKQRAAERVRDQRPAEPRE